MNILMLNYEYPPVGGGGGIICDLVAQTLAERHEVLVVTSSFRDLPRDEIRDGVRIRRVPVYRRESKSVASLSSLLTFPLPGFLAGLRLLRQGSFDLVNGHFAVPTAPASVALARLAGLPHVLTVHGGDIYNPTYRYAPQRISPLRPVVRRMLQVSDVVVSNSADVREKIHTLYDADIPVHRIPLGVRKLGVPPLERRALGLPEDAFLAVTVGRLIPRKGVERILQSFATPPCEDFHLVVVGSGPGRRRLENSAAALGIRGRIHFTGWVEERRKWQLLGCADMYVSASFYEGFGLVFLEAMASSLPIVCTASGGQTDFLSEGRTGHVVPCGDVDRLAAAIASLARDPERRVGIGRANRARFERHSVRRCALRYEALFAATIEGAVPSPREWDRQVERIADRPGDEPAARKLARERPRPRSREADSGRASGW